MYNIFKFKCIGKKQEYIYTGRPIRWFSLENRI